MQDFVENSQIVGLKRTTCLGDFYDGVGESRGFDFGCSPGELDRRRYTMLRQIPFGKPHSLSRDSLPGARGETKPANFSSAGLESETITHLFSLYGSRASEVINLAAATASLREPLSPHAPDIAAQVVFAARAEQCVRLVDFLLRRTLLGFSQDQGQSAADRVLSLLAQELGWSPERMSAEMSLYEDHIAMTQAFRSEAGS